MTDDEIGKQFVSRFVESYGLSLTNVTSLQNGSLRVHIFDPKDGPLFGNWTIKTGCVGPGYEVAQLFKDFGRALDAIANFDQGRMPNAIDLTTFIRENREAA